MNHPANGSGTPSSSGTSNALNTRHSTHLRRIHGDSFKLHQDTPHIAQSRQPAPPATSLCPYCTRSPTPDASGHPYDGGVRSPLVHLRTGLARQAVAARGVSPDTGKSDPDQADQDDDRGPAARLALADLDDLWGFQDARWPLPRQPARWRQLDSGTGSMGPWDRWDPSC